MMNVCFAHGKESGPKGRKIVALGKIAEELGLQVQSIDFTESPNPEHRVRKLLWNLEIPGEELILVGSSMGGYVTTVASKLLRPAGLFLMAPAFYLPGYVEQDPVPYAGKTVLVHGLRDDVVPMENAVRFAKRHRAELHLLQAGHTLTEVMDQVERVFTDFLLALLGKDAIDSGEDFDAAGKPDNG